MRLGNPFWLAALATLPAAQAALAQTVPQPIWPVGNAELRLAGVAEGAVSGAGRASGLLAVSPLLRRDYDSGLSLSLGSRIVAADPLSRGRYDGDALEYLAASARTGLGRFEVGLTDGAGYQLAVTGPKVEPGVALDDARTSLFADPAGRAVTNLLALRSAVGASSNYAKFAYVSPSLFGATLALSFAPSEGKQLPFLNAGPQVPGRQADFWEAAVKYEVEAGPVSLSAYGAVAEGRAEHKLPGQEGVSDLGAGLRADWPVTDDITVSAGGALRQSNAYGFDINQSWQAGTTRTGHVSAMVSDGAWRAGVEYGTGTADAVAALPRLGMTGWEASLGYTVSAGMRVTTGWQRLDYSRSSGAFFNGLPRLKLDAVFLHLHLATSDQ